MSENSSSNRSFLIIAILAILWNIMGVVAYLGMTMTPVEAIIETYGQEFGDIFASKPAWATGAFAIAVFGGLLGSIGLLLKKRWSAALLALSLLGVIIHDIWGVMAGTLSVVGTFDKVMTVAVIAVSIFLLWYARKKSADGTLN